MSTSLGDAVLELKADQTLLNQGMNTAQADVNGWLGGLSALGGQILGGVLAAGAAGIAAASGLMFGAIQNAMEAEQVQAQLNAVLKSTGGVAGVTAEQVNALAAQYASVTKFGDEAIVSGQNILLTFTNIGQDVFPAATATMLDMSQALGQDLQSSAVMLGKALQDPIAGVTALRRVGVNFTDAQMEMIATMVEAGDVAGAQALILNELQTEFGGSAEAAGATFGGQIEILKNKLGDMLETIGMGLLPALTQLAAILMDTLARPEVQAGIAAIAQGLADFAAQAIVSLPQIAAWFQQAFAWLMDNQGVIVGVLAALGAAIAAFVWTTVIPALVAAVTAAAPVILIMAAIGLAAYVLYTAWTNNWGGIQEKTAAAWAWIQGVLSNLWAWLSVNVPAGLKTLKSIWDTVWAGLQTVIGVVLPIIQSIFAAFKAAFEGDWYAFGANLRQAWDAAWEAILGGVTTIAAKIGEGLQTLRETLAAKMVAAIDALKQINWGEVGAGIISGIVQGIKNGAGALIEAAIAAAQAALEAAKGFLGIQSPSKVFERDVAGNMMAGWVAGIENAQAQLANATVQAGQAALGGANAIQTAPGQRVENRGLNIGAVTLQFRETDLTPESFRAALNQLEWQYG